MLEIKPREWRDKWGSRCKADYYPYIDGEPAEDIAGCEHCTLYREDDDGNPVTCDGWQGNEAEAPLFCGPICFKFVPKKI